jgi:hypothetical protein
MVLGIQQAMAQAPTITIQPTNASACTGGNTSFFLFATNATTYQWQVDQGSGFANVSNGGVYSGATSATLTLISVPLSMAGYNYRCIVSGMVPPNDTSNTVSLNVGGANITASPVNTFGCAGGNVTYTVAAAGVGLSYQWQENQGSGFVNVSNGGIYGGATSATLTLTGLTAGMDGYVYQCVVSSTCSSPATSGSASLTMTAAPTITAQPTAATTLCVNDNVTYTVAATGSGISYQWQVNSGSGFANVSNGGVYSGATTASLTITGATTLLNGNTYRCVVNNTCGAVNSTSAALTVNAPPTITTQPVSATVCLTDTAYYTVIATGSGISYQWQENSGSGFVNIVGGNYIGFNTATLKVFNLTALMSGYSYQCVVTGSCATTTNAATLTVNPTTTITGQPTSVIVCAGANASYTVLATGTGLTYQWQVNSGSGFSNVTNGGVYSGATSATLTITGATAGMNGYNYQCLVSSACSPLTSNTATLTVNTAPAITTQPTNVTVCSGNIAQFTVIATGTNLTYQWQENSGAGFANVVNGGVYAGATTATLTLNNPPVGMSGRTYQCIVSGACVPPIISSTALLTINTAPGITVQPASIAKCVGDVATFIVTASGTGLTYLWQENQGAGFVTLVDGGIYSGSATATLTLTGVTAAMTGYTYRCILVGTCNPGVTSSIATLTVNPLPVITGQPANATICAGANTTFVTTVTGTSGFSFQWQISTDGGVTFSNLVIAAPYSLATSTNATSTLSTLTITAATVALNNNQYRCIATRVATGCAATSTAAILTVNAAPAITTPPAATNVCVGGNTSFSVIATGAGLTYQWQISVNGGVTWNNVVASAIFSNVTTATLNITGATAAMNNNQFRVVVSGTCNPAATSAPGAVLTVNAVTAITAQPPNRTVCAGVTTTFTVTSAGAGLIYQWQENQGAGFANLVDGGIYSGSATPTLTLSGVTAAMTGYTYQCIVTGTCGNATSNIGTLTVNVSPTITTQPVATSVCVGQNTSYSVVATGAGLTYQWQNSVNGGVTWNNIANGAIFSGVTTATLNITGATAAMNNNQYRVVVTGTCAPAVNSAAALLTVNALPAITTQPAAATVCAGLNATYTVVATGAGLTYTWEENPGSGTFTAITDGGIYSGSATATLTLTGVTAGMNGYTYRCVVNGTCNPFVTSNAVLLTVNAAPSINTQPVASIICPTANTTFSVLATGTALTYQWQRSTDGGVTWNNLANVAPFSNVTTATMTITAATPALNNNQYRCVVSGTCAPAATSNAALLTINTNPVITTQPTSVITCIGNPATFSTVATTGNMNYQWQFSTNGGVTWNPIPAVAPFSGTTTSTLSISAVTALIGTYQIRCRITSVCATLVTPATTNVVSVILQNPTITAQPVNTVGCVAGSTNISLTATGGYLSYQWQVDSANTGAFTNVNNGGVYSGATTAILNINDAEDSMSGYKFRCVINGLCPPADTSNTVTFTVNNYSTWTGAISTAWSNGGNWTCGTVPTAKTNVIIPSAPVNQPLVDITTAICDSVFINGGSLAFAVAGASGENILEVKGSILNTTGIFNPAIGTVRFSGNQVQLVPGATYLNIEVEGFAHKTLTGDVNIVDSLRMINELFIIGDHNLFIGPGATIEGGNYNSYIVTSGTGMITEQNVGLTGKAQTVSLPIGPTTSSYNPAVMTNSGTTDNYSVMVLDSVYQHYFGNAPTSLALTSDAVSRTWIIKEAVAGGSNVSLTLQWDISQELPGFNHYSSYISHYMDTSWVPSTPAVALGIGPYRVTDSNFTILDNASNAIAFAIGHGVGGGGIGGSGSTSVSFITKGNGIMVYPNPVQGGELFVKFAALGKDEMKIRIIDVLGKVWYNGVADNMKYSNGIMPVNVSNLAAGVYMLQVTDASNNSVSSITFNKQ